MRSACWRKRIAPILRNDEKPTCIQWIWACANTGMGLIFLEMQVESVERATVVVSSITHAMRGEQLLRAAGFRVYMDRDTKLFGKYGCGYCLRIVGSCDAAIALLRQNRIKVREVIWG